MSFKTYIDLFLSSEDDCLYSPERSCTILSSQFLCWSKKGAVTCKGPEKSFERHFQKDAEGIMQKEDRHPSVLRMKTFLLIGDGMTAKVTTEEDNRSVNI